MRHAAWLLLGVVACQNDSLQPAELRLTEVVGELVQIVTVRPSSPRTGDRLQIASSVVNQGSVPRTVTLRVCDLDVQTNLSLRDDIPRCGADSFQTTLMPGDTISLDGPPVGGVIESAPGEYEVRIRHLRNPDHWVAFFLRVRNS